MIKLNAIKIGLYCMFGFGLLYLLGWAGVFFFSEGEMSLLYQYRWMIVTAIGQIGFCGSGTMWIVGLLLDRQKKDESNEQT